MGRFCDQFLNALDGLYKGRIIAQTAPESATGDTPLALGALFAERIVWGRACLLSALLSAG